MVDLKPLGLKRIGGQVDLRPDPIIAAGAALLAIGKNVGQKKEQSQRQKEKAAKSTGGETKEDGPAVNTFVSEMPATQEEAHANLLAALGAYSEEGGVAQETPQAAEVEAEVASWTKSLFCKCKKTKRMFMVSFPQSKAMNLKEVTFSWVVGAQVSTSRG